jgi:chromosome segregation ATPase
MNDIDAIRDRDKAQWPGPLGDVEVKFYPCATAMHDRHTLLEEIDRLTADAPGLHECVAERERLKAELDQNERAYQIVTEERDQCEKELAEAKTQVAIHGEEIEHLRRQNGALKSQTDIKEGVLQDRDLTIANLEAELAEARERPKKHTAYWYHHQGWEAATKAERRRCVEKIKALPYHRTRDEHRACIYREDALNAIKEGE